MIVVLPARLAVMKHGMSKRLESDKRKIEPTEILRLNAVTKLVLHGVRFCPLADENELTKR